MWSFCWVDMTICLHTACWPLTGPAEPPSQPTVSISSSKIMALMFIGMWAIFCSTKKYRHYSEQPFSVKGVGCWGIMVLFGCTLSYPSVSFLLFYYLVLYNCGVLCIESALRFNSAVFVLNCRSAANFNICSFGIWFWTKSGYVYQCRITNNNTGYKYSTCDM